MRAVTINCEFSLPRLIQHGLSELKHLAVCNVERVYLFWGTAPSQGSGNIAVLIVRVSSSDKNLGWKRDK
jgi:hypothetical protein